MLLALVANVTLGAAILGYGSLLQPIVPQDCSFVDRLTITMLGGLGLTGTLLFDIGLLRFSRAVVALILVAGTLALITALKRRSVLNFSRVGWPRVPLWPAMVIGIVIAVTVVGGLAKPVGDNSNDAIAYHFLGPKVWLRDGAIRPVPDEPLTAFPAIVESSYGALMAIGGPRAPELFAVTALLPLLLVSAALALRLGGGAAAAWWAAALVAAMPAVYRGAYGGFIDATYAAFVLCAVRIGFDAKRLRDFALFGIFCGFAMGTKYTGVIAVAILFVVLLALILRRPGGKAKSGFKGLALAGAAALVVALPPYIRNWIVLGCPIYPPTPGLLHFFRVKYLSNGAVEGLYHYVRIRGFGMGRSLKAFLLLPSHLTYYTARFNGAGGIGLAPLALAPFGIIAARRERFARALAAVTVFLTVAWFITDQESRFLIDVYAILGVFGALGMLYVMRQEPRIGRPLAALTVACSLMYGLFMIGRARAEDLHAVFSKSYAEQRQAAEVPYLASFQYLNSHRSVTKVLILDPSVAAYYCNKDYLKPIGAFGAQPIADPANIAGTAMRLQRLHISDILDVHSHGKAFQLPEHMPGLTLVFGRADQRIYRVDSAGTSSESDIEAGAASR